VCIHQSEQEAQCIVIDTRGMLGERSGEGEPDGRSCDNAYICEKEGREHVTYACEKVGLFGTFSEGMRVRWRGTLGDPNELAVALGAIMPLMFAFGANAKRKLLGALVLGMLGVALWCVVLTGSRGGQLVILTVLGFYFVRRYGAKGAIAGALLALPVLLLGGRAGEEAESSSVERIQLLYEGMDMIKASPLVGVGTGEFFEHTSNHMTAHNSYVLAAAELGLPGSLLWMMLVYTSVKIPFVVAIRPPTEMDPRLRSFALALVVSFAGILVGVFFLSFCYKALLFIFFGLSGALYGAAKKANPRFDVGVSFKEIGRVAAP
jgi:O-antigen ligase